MELRASCNDGLNFVGNLDVDEINSAVELATDYYHPFSPLDENAIIKCLLLPGKSLLRILLALLT